MAGPVHVYHPGMSARVARTPRSGVVSRSRTLALCAVLLLALCIGTFSGLVHNGFTNFDDPDYVTKNPNVQHGIAMETVRWAFTTGRTGNWHPLTWLSHGLDWQLFGAGAAGHHLSSLFFHTANALLLFFLLAAGTGRVGRSAVVAALFACHPLHVESVAWIAERKDVLSTSFWLLTTGAYGAYARRPSPGRYGLVVAGFALGLMAKPMLVTLPFTLLLLDYWPLGRWPTAPGPGKSAGAKLVLEKVPLFAMAAASSLVTFLVQSANRGSFETYTPAVRLANAAVSYGAYIWHTFWPVNLAIFYPHPRSGLPAWAVAASLLLLAAVTVIAVRTRQSRPYVIAGWFWYLGTLVPVIGIVQVGSQARADRYTYVPLIGIFVAVTWAVADLSEAVSRRGRPVAPPRAETHVAFRPIAVVAVLAVLALSALARQQVSTWRDPETLFRHAIAATGDDNSLAHFELGESMTEAGRLPQATAEYERVLQINPGNGEALTSLGRALLQQGRIEEAARNLERAVELNPRYARAHNNLGIALASTGRRQDALVHFQEAVTLDPELAESHSNLGLALAQDGRLPESLEQFRAALRLEPGLVQAHANLALVFARMGDVAHAREEAEAARAGGLELPPPFWQALEGHPAAKHD
jgi:protein O-mannosyl-transferase